MTERFVVCVVERNGKYECLPRDIRKDAPAKRAAEAMRLTPGFETAYVYDDIDDAIIAANEFGFGTIYALNEDGSIDPKPQIHADGGPAIISTGS